MSSLTGKGERAMDIREAIEARHSIRSYTDRPIDGAVERELRELVAECNRESGLAFRLCLDEPRALSSLIGRIGLKNVRNYLALVGTEREGFDELCGYYGEKVVLRATQLGLGSCWFAMGYRKSAIPLATDERLLMLIALGYPAVEGKVHRSRPLGELYRVESGGEGTGDSADGLPVWFEQGLKAAQLAPTARNQQKFRLTLTGSTVKAESTGGIFSRVDLGIVRYHFEAAAGPENFEWA
jgi:nitroreductase